MHISPHLVRAPSEPVDSAIADLYSRLLALLRRPALRHGDWRLLDCHPAWEGNWTHVACIAFAWEAPAAERVLVVVNYSDHQSQARVELPFATSDSERWRLDDLLGAAVYDRAGAELATHGLFVDLPAWGCHVFALQPGPEGAAPVAASRTLAREES